VFATAFRQIVQYAVMVRDGLSEPPAESYQLSVNFLDPEFRSVAANADAVAKLASLPVLQDSTVILEEVFDSDQIERIRAEVSRNAAPGVLAQLMQRAQERPSPPDEG